MRVFCYSILLLVVLSIPPAHAAEPGASREKSRSSKKEIVLAPPLFPMPPDTLIQTEAQSAVCSNGQIEAGEECDDGNSVSGDGCSSECSREMCGDGIVHKGLKEQCDDGNKVSGDGCSETCHVETLEEQAKAQESAGCGNGKLDPSEECDDGNTTSGDGCSAGCKTEFCGDGVLQSGLGEECDDGNKSAGDGCTADCRKKAALAVCGNSKVEAGEECDDGNTADGDGCSAGCTIEKSINCNDPKFKNDPECTPKEEPVQAVCGDGLVQSGEQCDDGNVRSGDGCSSSCARESCGDGIVQSSLGEECDDHNTSDGDGCDSQCKKEVGFCGNGIVEPWAIGSAGPEECDDGNATPGDGCDSNCRLEQSAIPTSCGSYRNCNTRCGEVGGSLEVEESCGSGNDQWQNNPDGSCSCPAGRCIQVPCFSV